MCNKCEYRTEDGTCGAFECNGVDCPDLPCEKWWVFTFGSGQQHAGHYVKIRGTYGGAREKMFEKYGKDWAFQYSEEEWRNWELNRPIYVPIEKELEVIE